MNERTEQSTAATSAPGGGLPPYPLWVRVVAALIRLPVRALLPSIRMSKKILAGMRQNSRPVLPVLEEMEGSWRFYVWVGFLCALMFMGAYVLLITLVHSMEVLEFYRNIPWATMVSNYVFLVGSSVGLCLVASLGYVFGLQRYEVIARQAVFLAMITMMAGLASITLHLGHPERSAIYSGLTPNIRSAMWYLGTLYPPYIALVALWYWLLARRELVKKAEECEGLKAKVYRIIALEGLRPYLNERFPLKEWEAKIYRLVPLERMGLSLDSEGAEQRWAHVVGPLALVFGLLAYTAEGSLFAHVEARPFWYGALFVVDFLLGAAFTGLAWLMTTGVITYRVTGEEMPLEVKDLFYEMAQILAVLLSLGVLFNAYKIGHGLFEPAKAKTIMLFLNGPFRIAFWVFEITIGLFIPLFALLYGATRRKMGWLLGASVMVLVGYFVKRYDFVVASQVFPLIKKTQPLSSYTPTLWEMFLVGGIIAAVLLAYTLGIRFLPLKERMRAPRTVTE